MLTPAITASRVSPPARTTSSALAQAATPLALEMAIERGRRCARAMRTMGRAAAPRRAARRLNVISDIISPGVSCQGVRAPLCHSRPTGLELAQPMFGIDRRAAYYTWTAVLVVLLVWLVYLVRATLFIFILALLFAYLLAPLVNLFDRFLPGRRTRTPALALAYILLVGVVILAGSQIGTRAVDEANNLAKKFPEMLQRWETADGPTG